MRSNTEYWPKSLGTSVGITTGFGTSLGLANINTIVAAPTLAVGGPIFFGGLIGVMLFVIPTTLLQQRIDNTFNLGTKPMENRCCHFLLQTASMTLSILVGLAIMSAFMSLIANPFTLPALLVGGISASIMLGIYAMTRPVPSQQPVPRTHSPNLRAEMLSAAESGQFDDNTNAVVQLLLAPRR